MLLIACKIGEFKKKVHCSKLFKTKTKVVILSYHLIIISIPNVFGSIARINELSLLFQYFWMGLYVKLGRLLVLKLLVIIKKKSIQKKTEYFDQFINKSPHMS